MAKSDLARRLLTRQTELDVVLQELERAGRVKLTEIKGKSWWDEGKPTINYLAQLF